MDDNLTKMLVEEAKRKFKNGEIKSGTDVEDFMDNLFQPVLM